MFKVVRQQLWALTVFVTCGLAVFLWTTESASYLYRIAQNNAVLVMDEQNDNGSGFSSFKSEDDDSKRNNNEEQLAQLNLDLLSNGTDDLVSPIMEPETESFDATNSAVTALPPVKLNSTDTNHLTNTTSPNKPSTRKPKRKRDPSKSGPQFQWCYDNKTLNAQIMHELPCNSLFEGNNGEHDDSYTKAKEYGKAWASPCEYSDEEIADLALQNCTLFRQSFNFLDDNMGVPPSKEEQTFPLAYVMVAEKWAAQVIRILSAVYRSPNLYCITWDEHSSSEFKRALNATVQCLPNFILPEQHLEIYWADISLLKATLNCIRALHEHRNDWRYVQILSYNDFPLKTNLEMVQILRHFHGANDVELTGGQPERFVRYHKLSELDNNRVNDSRPVPPASLVIYKGSFAATLSREFIRFVFENKIAGQFLEWSETTWAPEEQFWATLVHNEHINAPGKFPGACLEYYRHGNVQKLWISRYQVWYSGCEGRWTSGSCVFGVGDLPTLRKRQELIAHKFYTDFEPATFYCLARRHFERTYVVEKDWEFQETPLDIEYYANLPAVQYQRTKDKESFSCAIKFKKRE